MRQKWICGRSFVPYDLATLKTPNSERRRLVEVISRPFPSDNGDRIKIRQVPGEPTTLDEVAVGDLQHVAASVSGRMDSQHRYLHVARVFSTFHLPPDMLRYDDAYLFEHSLHEDGPVHELASDENDRRGLRVPEEGLLVYKAASHTGKVRPVWTIDRWRSFACRIEPVIVRDLLNAKIVKKY
jgi:hypothetical protein